MGVSILIVCAVLASLTAGVLAAYGVVLVMFAALRSHARQTASARRPVATQPALGS